MESDLFEGIELIKKMTILSAQHPLLFFRSLTAIGKKIFFFNNFKYSKKKNILTTKIKNEMHKNENRMHLE